MPPVAHEVTAPLIASTLRRYRFRYYANERDLQDAIAHVLRQERLPVEREARLDAHSRVDLLVARFVVEVKIAGGANAVRRQLERYAASERVDGLVLVTTRARHVYPDAIGGKPLEVVSLLLGGL